MPLHRLLFDKLNKIYEPSATIDDVFKGHDITFVTNENGEPVMLFIGKRRPDGVIIGERYKRTIKRASGDAQAAASHWDLKGKSHM
ncbi:hypothetical protein H8B13_14900 [Hymenobacter sp. BT188]|uniref:hypothetical protein n=1 Tax=Hymenobacter sp. BT188 TaxID=2763504 RepID=UPI0016519E18|nr:hypothetical protein [Hymenobacter sp. BT188]MBC6608113.1 hypothetical protein [Hymenobacter sp. BT188]